MDDIESQLPLTETILLILLSMAQAPRHGYAIMKEVTALSNGRVNLSTGTLYGALSRLLDAGWIVRVLEEESEEMGRSRKEYHLTERGRRLLSQEIQRMQALVSIARVRVAGGEL